MSAERNTILQSTKFGEFRDYLEPQLSRVKMPKAFDFRPELPREANGKLYKRELRDEYARLAETERA